MAKNFIYMTLLGLYVLGTIGGIGYSIYYGEWITAIAIVVLAVMAFPKAKEYFDYLFIKDI